MIEVFKTSVGEQRSAQKIINVLQKHFPDSKINFDLGDCDNVLRVEGENLLPGSIIKLLQSHGFICEALD